MTGVAVVVVDRLGRRPLLLGGVSGMVSPFTSLFLELLEEKVYMFFNQVCEVIAFDSCFCLLESNACLLQINNSNLGSII